MKVNTRNETQLLLKNTTFVSPTSRETQHIFKETLQEMSARCFNSLYAVIVLRCTGLIRLSSSPQATFKASKFALSPDLNFVLLGYDVKQVRSCACYSCCICFLTPLCLVRGCSRHRFTVHGLGWKCEQPGASESELEPPEIWDEGRRSRIKWEEMF